MRFTSRKYASNLACIHGKDTAVCWSTTMGLAPTSRVPNKSFRSHRVGSKRTLFAYSDSKSSPRLIGGNSCPSTLVSSPMPCHPRSADSRLQHPTGILSPEVWTRIDLDDPAKSGLRARRLRSPPDFRGQTLHLAKQT